MNNDPFNEWWEENWPKYFKNYHTASERTIAELAWDAAKEKAKQDENTQLLKILEWYRDKVSKLCMFYNGPGLFHANEESLEAHKELEKDKGQRAGNYIKELKRDPNS